MDAQKLLSGEYGEPLDTERAIDELQSLRAQLALADKVIQAARKHFHWAGGRGHNVACNYPDDTAPRCNCGSNDLRTALAEYDRGRATP